MDRKECAKVLWPREERVQSVLETKRKPVWLEQKDAPWRAGVGLCPGRSQLQAHVRRGSTQGFILDEEGSTWPLWTSLITDIPESLTLLRSILN